MLMQKALVDMVGSQGTSVHASVRSGSTSVGSLRWADASVEDWSSSKLLSS